MKGERGVARDECKDVMGRGSTLERKGTEGGTGGRLMLRAEVSLCSKIEHF